MGMGSYVDFIYHLWLLIDNGISLGKMLKKIQNKTLKNRVENSEVSRVQLFIQSVAIFF